MNLDNKYLKAWLTFNQSPTEDVLLNQWTTYGNPTIGTANAFNGKALQLDGQSYIKLSGIELGGQDFYIDGWVYVDSSSSANARVIHIVNPSTGYTLVSVRKNSSNASRLDFWSNGYADVSQDSGQTNVPSITSVGQRVHFKLIYRYTDKIFALCINDKTYVHRTSAPQYNRRSFDIYIGALPNGNQGLIGAIDELRIYDGTWFSYAGENLPTLAEYQQIKFTADVLRKVLNDARLWRYVNLGTADKLTVTGTTLENLSEDKSVTGTAFYQTARVKCFDIPATPEVWLKFDLYHYSGTSRFRIYDDSNGSTANGFVLTQNSSTQVALWSWDGSANYSRKTFDGVLKANTLQTWILHMSSGASGGLLELWCDGEFVGSWTGNVNNGEDFANIYLQTDDEKNLFSNVVISNKELTFGDGYQTFTADVERKLSNVVEFTADVQRGIMEVINVPFIFGDHFNHCCSVEYDAPTTSIGRPLKIKLPNKSKAYVHATALNGGAFKVFSDTDAVGTVTGDVYAALDECESVFVQKVVAPQSILYMFLNSLRYRGGSALDSAIENCTYGVFPSKDELVNSFLNDLDNSESNLDFLSRCCGVDLSNDDTGAVIGSDAGGGYPKTAKSIVPEPVPVEDWIVPEKGSSKTIAGLTVYFPTSGYKGTLTDAENHILAGLNSVWIEQALLLIQRSCNIDFRTNQTNIVHDISVKFVDENNDALAYVSITTKDGSTTSLELRVNMRRYSGINMTSEDGAAGSNTYLDRVLAHEMTHAVMAARIKNYTELPRFLREGIAEFIHGIDDERKSDIQYLTQTAQRNTLQSIFSTGGDSGDINIYSAGYLFFRYMIKQTLEKGTFPLERYSSTGHIRLFISDGAVDYFGNALTDNTRAIFSADVLRELIKSTSFNADVAIFDMVPVEFTADVMRSIIGKVKLYRVDNSAYFEENPAGGELTPVVIPSQSLTDIGRSPAAPNNTNGLQSVEITIAEQQITDSVHFVGVVPFDIMYPVRGQYLDYLIDMRVERVQKHGVLYSCDCCSDIDALLYTQIAYKVDDEQSDTENSFTPAAAHAKYLANVLGKTPVIQFAPFNSTVMVDNSGGVTYADLIREIFWWTSRVPTMLINVFIRDDKIYFVQRGHEARLIDLSETKHTVPTVTHELVRMTWGSTLWSKTETREHTSRHWEPTKYDYSDVYNPNNNNPNNNSIPTPQDGDEETWVTVQDVSTGIDWIATTTYQYYPKVKGSTAGSLPNALGGLLAKVTTSKHSTNPDNPDSYTQITHRYNEDRQKIYTETYVHYSGGKDTPKDTRTVNTSSYITLPNGEKFLASESSTTYEGDSISDYPTEVVDSTSTTHSPGRQGQTHTVKFDSDGEIIGEVFGQNTGDDRVTPFSQNKASSLENGTLATYRYNGETGEWEKTGEWKEETDTQSRTVNGLSLYDSSFPVHGDSKLVEITEAIKWLNRRTKETVTMTIYEYPHLIDFNDRIIFEGAEYFLVSNTAATTERIFNEQRVTFVRWY